MDIKGYIASGIIEEYVIGSCSVQDRNALECLANIYPELKREVEHTQSDMEAYISSYSVSPKASLKDLIMDALEQTPQETGTNFHDNTTQKKDVSEKNTPVIPISAPQKSSAKLTWLVAACAVIAALAVGAWIFTNNELSSLKSSAESNEVIMQKRLTEMRVETEAYQAELTKLNSEKSNYERLMSFIQEPETMKTVLRGTKRFPNCGSVEYCNHLIKKMYIDPTALPDLEDGKQYQAWSIKDGEVVNMGLIDRDSEELQALSIEAEEADSFAITIEPKGGSTEPTKENMVVMGSMAPMASMEMT